MLISGLASRREGRRCAPLVGRSSRRCRSPVYDPSLYLRKRRTWHGFGLLIRIDPAWMSTIVAVKYASRPRCVHAAAAGVSPAMGKSRLNTVPSAGTVFRVPVPGSHHALALPARKSRDLRVATKRSGVPICGARSLDRHQGRTGVQKVPMVAAFPPPSLAVTVPPAKAVCVSRFAHLHTNGLRMPNLDNASFRPAILWMRVRVLYPNKR